MGAVCTLGAWLLSSIALIFVGGDEYADVQSRLWLFAVLGTALAILQLVVYSVLARQGTRSVYLVWLAVVVLVGCGLLTSTLPALVVTVASVDAVLVVVLLALSLYRMRDEAHTPGPAPEAPTPA